MSYNRKKQWEQFNEQMKKHIEQYTLVQYGTPEGNEQVDDFSSQDCWLQLQKYVTRRNSNARGEKEQLRDLLKIAHYANFIYDKLKEEKGLPDVY